MSKARLKKLSKQVRPHLQRDELIVASVLGQFETSRMGMDSLKTGAMFATNQRLVFFTKWISGFNLEHFPYQNISSFEVGKKLMGHYVAFFASGNEVKLKWIRTGDMALFSRTVREAMEGDTSVSTQPVINDAIDKLERLGKLRDAGVVSGEEFELKKHELLNRL